MKPTTTGIIALVVIITILSTLNTHNVRLNLIFWKPEIALIVLIFGLLGTGFLTGYLVKGLSGYRHKKKNGAVEKENEK